MNPLGGSSAAFSWTSLRPCLLQRPTGGSGSGGGRGRRRVRHGLMGAGAAVAAAGLSSLATTAGSPPLAA